MFDIGFWELMLIGVIALLVVGPDKLPGLARTVGMWVGKGKRLIASVQNDINREINKADELKRLLEEQKKIVERHEIIEELKQELPLGNQPSIKQKHKPATDTSPEQTKLPGDTEINKPESRKNPEHEQ